MKWKGRRQSTNVEDATLDPLPDIWDGEDVRGIGPWHNTPTTEAKKKQVNAERDVARRGDNVPTPTSRPGTITKTQVTPGKWKTVTK